MGQYNCLGGLQYVLKEWLLSVAYKNNFIVVQRTKQCLAVVRSWKEPTNISLTAAKKCIFLG